MILIANHARRVASLVVALALANVQGAEAQLPPLTGTVETLSSSGTTYDYPAVSADGRHVAFISELQLEPADVSPTWFDIYVRDRQLGTTVLVSKSTTGVPGNGRSQRPSISADGRFVAFSSSASNLVPGDTNDVDDIFVHDRDADGNGIFDEPGGTPLTSLTRVSVSSDGSQANCVSVRPSISGTGRYVAFDSCATNWSEVQGKTLAVQDIFVHDTESGLTMWVNPPTRNSTNGFNNHHSGDASISADGRHVAFGSQATTQPQDINHFGSSQIYVRDTCLGAPAGCGTATEWASPQVHVDGQPSDTFKPAISANGRFVAFESRSTSMVPGDTNEVIDIFVFDRQTREVTRVNVSAAGEQALTIGPSTCSGSLHASISGNGRLVTFESCANNLVADDSRAPNYQDVFVHDRDADGNGVPDEPGGVSTTLISRNPLGAPADSSSLYPTISSNGNVVVFSSFSRDITPTASPIGIFAWTSVNRSPVADAGPDQTVALTSPEGTVVTLDGSASHDPDSDHLTFSWSGPFGTQTGATISPTLPAGTHTITLTVDDGRGSTASDSVTVIIGSGADLSITATATPDPVNTNDDLTYSLVVTNGGPANATGVEVTMELPADVTFVDGNTPQGSCSGPPAGTPGPARCTPGTIANGATVTLSIEVSPTTAGPLTLSASVSGTESDANTTNNSATVNVTVRGPVVIDITETIAVTDAAGVLPSALLLVAEMIAVQDAPNLLPSALLGINESITVTDAPGVQLSGNTPLGTNVSLTPLDATTGTSPVRLTFDTVTQPGHTVLAIGVVGPPPPPGFAGGNPPAYYDLSTTAAFTGPVQVCVSYVGTTFGRAPSLWHYDNTAWVNITIEHDAARQEVCGDTLSLSPFALFEPLNQPLSLSLPPSLVAEATSAAGASVDYTATAGDPEDGSIATACLPPSGSMFSLGVATVACSATDSGGEQVSGSFTVTVRDTTRPVLFLPGTIAAIATSAAGAVVIYNPTATDLVDGSFTPACSPASGATYRVGTTSVTCTATDAHGNTAVGSFSVTVKLGLPVIVGDVTATGRDAAGRVYVDLTLTNRGTGHARSIRLTTVKLITLSGKGTVTYNAALSGVLPLDVGYLDAGGSAFLRLYLNVPKTVTRFTIIEAGTLKNVIGTRLPFIAAQIVAVPR
jgi:uncharacterized repeat protein (TIGR01451 family)